MSTEKKDQVDYCPRCGRAPEKDDKFCIACGAPVINRCTKKKSPLHKGCSKVNRHDAAFCSACGHPTTFREHGLL
jgi:uncharacterized membrane protein YvbJ